MIVLGEKGRFETYLSNIVNVLLETLSSDVLVNPLLCLSPLHTPPNTFVRRR